MKKGVKKGAKAAPKCCANHMWYGWVVLLVGLLYLLGDLGYLPAMENISWYTALFLLIGIHKLTK